MRAEFSICTVVVPRQSPAFATDPGQDTSVHSVMVRCVSTPPPYELRAHEFNGA